MLTAAHAQVNAPIMESSTETTREDRQKLHTLAGGLLNDTIRARGPRKVLVISPEDDLLALPRNDRRMYPVHVNSRKGAMPSGLQCTMDALPFLTDSFELVVALHLFKDGRGPVLAEIERVLIGGGFLLTVGHARWSRAGLGTKEYPSIKPFSFCRRLHEHSFRVEQCEGLGLAGYELSTGSGWKKPLLGASDLVMVRARYQENRPIIRRVNFSRPRTRAGAATVEPLSRKAAS